MKKVGRASEFDLSRSVKYLDFSLKLVIKRDRLIPLLFYFIVFILFGIGDSLFDRGLDFFSLQTIHRLDERTIRGIKEKYGDSYVSSFLLNTAVLSRSWNFFWKRFLIGL